MSKITVDAEKLITELTQRGIHFGSVALILDEVRVLEPDGWEDRLSIIEDLGSVDFMYHSKEDVSVYQTQRWSAMINGVEIGGDGSLRSISGSGDTPADAALDLWAAMTNLPEGKYLVKDSYGEDRQHFVWTGLHWKRLPGKTKP
jgi:hypothetical protein